MLKFDFNNMMQSAVGDKGISQKQFDEYLPLAQKAFDAVQSKRGEGWQGWMTPAGSDVVDKIMKVATNVRENFDVFVVLGIGGSALGPIAVFNALCHLYHNELPREKRNAPKFYVIDNADPERMNALFDVIDLRKTAFNVITKSGATSETMSQYLVVYDMLQKAYGKEADKHVFATTSEKKGNLIKLAKQHGFETFFIPEGVGGRFSELSPVGLFPAAVLGIDVKGLLIGSISMDAVCRNPDVYGNPALMSALLQFIAMKNGANISVMMPYADSLKYIADWYCQLWAESLGKEVDRDGKTVNVGQTPVKALGVTDQHSQVQLYTEGPFDKVVTFLQVGEFRSNVVIPQGCEEYPDVNFLCGHDMGELVNTELFATRFALTKKHRMNYTITMECVDAYNIGQLLYLFQMQTAFAGELLNVDAYNQPGVEEGKNATYALFGRSGYEQKKAELDQASKNVSNDKFVIDCD